MKIVVLDGYAANPGDLNWDELRTLGECEIYDRTAPDEVLERSKDAEAILTNKVVITAEHMASLPNLKYIGVIATGYNIIDVAAAKERGITVTNIPACLPPSEYSIMPTRFVKDAGLRVRIFVTGILRLSSCWERR